MCVAYKIPHSEFLSWSRSDRDKAIWWHVREQERCGSCGTRKAEWDPEQGGDRLAYTAVKQRCPGCEAQQRAETSISKSDGKGIHVQMVRNPRR